jgi:HK97 family phage portal protein
MGPSDYQKLFGDGRIARANQLAMDHARIVSSIKSGGGSSFSGLTLTDPRLYSESVTSAGVSVSGGSALRYSAFFACTRLMAELAASLPIQVLEVKGDRKLEARDYPLWSVLRNSPNADQTPFEFIESMMLAVILNGNFVARKFVSSSGRLISIEPINPNLVDIYRRADRTIGYRWNDDEGAHDLGENEILHVRGFGGGPLRGMSILGFAREALGLAVSANSSASSIFKNGLRPSSVLSFKDFLTEEHRTIAETSLVENYIGAMNAGKPFIAEGGVTLTPLSMNAEDSQLLESRGFSIEEVCRFFGMVPFMIGHTEKTTGWGTGIAEQVNGFYKFTFGPLLRKIQQRFSKQLIPATDRARYSVEFNVEGLLAADPKGRVELYRGLGQLRAITVNEIRRQENMPPVAWGDEPISLASNSPASPGTGDKE